MASSEDFKDFVLDQLEGLGELRSRKMFGEYGLYCDDSFFAIVAKEAIWFKVDDGNRAMFEERGMKPFSPFEDGKSMQYYEVPIDVLEDPGQLLIWAAESLAIARKAPKRKKRK
ncbi:TfoX/Sxy family protein [bacterium]|nr:TfoX/Sxy family protein [bacterium]